MTSYNSYTARSRKGQRRARVVWAAVSARPDASIRELACLSKTSVTCTAGILHFLAGCGYIEIVPGQSRARRVLVPFIATRRRS